MGYINVQRKIGGGNSPTYIAEKVNIKETIEAPEMNEMSLTLIPYSNNNPPPMSDDFVAGPFTFTTKGYYIQPTTLWSNYSTINSFEGVVKFKFNSLPEDTEQIMIWENLFAWEIFVGGYFRCYSYTANSYAYVGNTQLNLNTWYWLKVEIDSYRNVTYSVSTDGINYTQIVSFTDGYYSWSNVYAQVLAFGYHSALPSSQRQFDNGVIDFKETSVKINGQDIFYYIYQQYNKYYDNTEGGNNS